MKGKDIHDYKIPNNPDNNDWHNLALEDIGLYWDLPNFDECMFYYFRAVNFSKESTGAMLDVETPVEADSVDDIINYHYGWKFNELFHKLSIYGFGSFSLLSATVFMTASALV